MANLRDIRRRIKSVRNTAQITRAMQLVAAAKMKKAQQQATAGRAYSDHLSRVMADLKAAVGEQEHPLLERRGGDRTLVLVISTDKGLCGGLNTNLARRIRADIPADAHFVTVGRKLRQQLLKLRREMIADFEVRDPVPFAEARPIARFLTQKFLGRDYDTIKVVFSNFVTTMTQTPWVSQLLPIEETHIGGRRRYEADTALPVAGGRAGGGTDYLFEPGAPQVLGALLPLYVNFQVYQMLLEARASEHSARMVAMKSATDNASQMIKDLTLELNKVRQAAITAELLEISTAMKAME